MSKLLKGNKYLTKSNNSLNPTPRQHGFHARLVSSSWMLYARRGLIRALGASSLFALIAHEQYEVSTLTSAHSYCCYSCTYSRGVGITRAACHPLGCGGLN